MPAPVPPGHTRGAIVVIGPNSTSIAETTNGLSQQRGQQQLWQRFWSEAGGYGARIVICGTPGTEAESSAYHTLLMTMEAASVQQIQLATRGAALEADHSRAIEGATGILLLAPTPFHLAALLGGTPLATTIRRANARGKTVAGAGDSAAFLCQHMITANHTDERPKPRLLRDLIHFAPGLGLVNRLLFTVASAAKPTTQHHLVALLTAVAHNPFLIGVAIEANTGIVIYPDTTVEVFGANNVLLVDGHLISYTDIHEAKRDQLLSVHGVQLHLLKQGQTYNFDTHTVHPQSDTDIPVEGAPEHVTF
ncbi:MAG: hypothetical protein R3E79_41160 [Caldilineaceae bacterium]